MDDDTWSLYRNRKIIQSSDFNIHTELQKLMNHVLPPAEIIATLDPQPAIPLPSGIIEKKIKRLQWRWSRIRNYPHESRLTGHVNVQKDIPGSDQRAEDQTV